jgi:hypothetical protein
MRLPELEHTGVLPPFDPNVKLLARNDNEPFSANELIDCLARYWDVFVRGAATTPGDADAPYRWMLQQADDAQLANVTLPILAFHALGSARPVELFCTSFDRALHSSAIARALAAASGDTTRASLACWQLLIEEAVHPARRELHLPNFLGGWDIMDNGVLGAHPIYASYRSRVRALRNLVRTTGPLTAGSTSDLIEAVELSRQDYRIVFALPGLPVYRFALGSQLPPPRVRFDNLTLHSETVPGAAALRALAEVMGQPVAERFTSLKTTYDHLDARLERFRTADEAASIGIKASE